MNFIDLFLLIVFLRVIYIAISRGVINESFKIAGLFVSGWFSFHYYFPLGNKIGSKILFFSEEHLYFISFFLIFFIVKIIFSLLRLIVVSLFKRKEIPLYERWLLFFLGGGRAAILCSVIGFSLYLSPLDSKYLNESVSYSLFKNIAPKAYLTSFEFYSKINPNVILNEKIKEYYETEKSLSGSNKKGN